MSQRSPLYNLFISRACFVFSDQLLAYGMPLLVYQIRHSMLDSGIAFFFQTFPRLVALYLSGRLSDLWGGVKVHELADLGRFFVCILCLVSSFFASGTILFWTLSISGGLIAFCNALAYVGLETATGRIASGKTMASTQAQFQTIDQIAMLAGPVAASTLAIGVGKVGLLGIAAFTFGLSFFNLLKLRTSEPAEGTPIRGITSLSVLKEVFAIRELLGFTLLSTSINLAVGIYKTLLPALITHYYRQPESRMAWITAFGALIAIACVKPVGRFLDAKKSSVSTGTASFWALVCLLLLSSLAPFWIFFILTSLTVVCMAVFNVCQRTTRLQLLPKEVLGRSIGLLILVNQVTLPLSGLIVAGLSSLNSNEMMTYRLGLLAACLLGSVPSAILLRPNLFEKRPSPA